MDHRRTRPSKPEPKSSGDRVPVGDDGLDARTLLLRLKCDARAFDVFVCSFKLYLTLRANFDPSQPRIPGGQTGGGRWTNAGGTPVVPQPARDRFAQLRTGPRGPTWIVPTRRGPMPASSVEGIQYDIAFMRAQYEIARVRSVDPNWNPAPALRSTVRGEIEYQRSIPAQAEAHLRSLERPLPGSRPGIGHNGPPNDATPPAARPWTRLDPPTIALVAPNGQPIGTRAKGAGDNIYTINEPTMRELMLRLTTGSVELPTTSNYPGVYYELADRCVIGFRLSSQSGTTIDVQHHPNFVPKSFKLHFRGSK